MSDSTFRKENTSNGIVERWLHIYSHWYSALVEHNQGVQSFTSLL